MREREEKGEGENGGRKEGRAGEVKAREQEGNGKGKRMEENASKPWSCCFSDAHPLHVTGVDQESRPLEITI